MISHRPYFLAASLPKLISIPLCAFLAFLFSATSVPALSAQPLANTGANPGSKPLSQYVRDIWTTDNGLPQNSPVGLTQTRDGYLWFGTQEGLVRFDGLKFTVYDGTTVDVMGSRNINCLYEDVDSSLWIGVNGSALRLKSGVFTGFRNKQGLPGGADFSGFQRLRSGVFLAATYYGLFASRDPLTEKFKPYPDTSFQRLPTAAILESQHSDTLWIGSLGGLIAVHGGKRVATYTVKDGLAGNNITALCEDRRGRLIIGTASGVSVREGGRFTTYTVKDGLQNEAIAVLMLDTGGTLWLGSPSGLMRFSGGVIDFARADGVSGFDARSVCRDREGSIWIGTSATGLIRLRDSKFTNITAEDGLPGDVVFPMLESRDGSVWIGTDRRGISQVRGGKVVKTFYNRVNNEFDSQSFAEDGDGNLWLGSRGAGIKLLRQGKLTFYTAKDGLAHNAVAAMLAGTDTDGKSLMWLGTQGGLCKFKDGKFSTFSNRPLRSIDNLVVQALSHSRDGGLLLANFFGYSRFKNGNFTTVGYPDSIYTGITVICEDIDAPGTLWIATTGAGLIRFKDGHFTRIRAKHGLFDDVMWTLIDDRLGYFWTSSNKGVSRISKKDLNAFADSTITSFTCNVFGTADGMKNRECNSSAPAGLRDKDGKLWFSTVKGAAIIDPKNLLPNTVPPPVIIETVRIDSAIFSQPPAVIEAGASRFEFHYAGLSFIAPEKVTYKYQLTGFDKTWIEAGANRTAYYTNLPSGDYTFKVIAANNDGVWNDAGAGVSFTLRPYFYQTLWFYGLCAIGFVALGAGGYGLRVRQLQREQSRLSKLVDERTRALSAEKEKLAAAYSTIEIDNDRKTKELEDARQLQFSMLPKDVPQMPGLDIAVYMKTATEVGGDYYDFKILSDGTLIAAIGDATGHGMKAGIMVATAKSYFQTFASEQGNLPTLSQISDGIKRMNLRGLYMGLTLLRYKQHRLDVAAAGMPPLFFYRSKSAAVERVVLKGMPLGSFTNFPYQEFSTTLEAGDAVLLVSDGLEEMFNGQREMLGLGAVEAEFTRVAASSPAIAIERLVSIAETWAAGTPQADDMTLMVLKLK